MKYYTLVVVTGHNHLTEHPTPEERDAFAERQFKELIIGWSAVNVIKIAAEGTVTVAGILQEFDP